MIANRPIASEIVRALVDPEESTIVMTAPGNAAARALSITVPRKTRCAIAPCGAMTTASKAKHCGRRGIRVPDRRHILYEW